HVPHFPALQGGGVGLEAFDGHPVGGRARDGRDHPVHPNELALSGSGVRRRLGALPLHPVGGSPHVHSTSPPFPIGGRPAHTGEPPAPTGEPPAPTGERFGGRHAAGTWAHGYPYGG